MPIRTAELKSPKCITTGLVTFLFRCWTEVTYTSSTVKLCKIPNSCQENFMFCNVWPAERKVRLWYN